MKIHRHLAILSAILATQLAFAGNATVDSVKGTAGPVTGNKIETSNVNDTIPENAVIRTGNDSSITLKLSDGSKLTIGPNSSVSLKFVDGKLSITLNGGIISGIFAAGAIVSVPGKTLAVGGTTSAVSLGNGTTSIASNSGSVKVNTAPENKDVQPVELATVVAGEMVSLGANTSTIAPLTQAQVDSFKLGTIPDLPPPTKVDPNAKFNSTVNQTYNPTVNPSPGV